MASDGRHTLKHHFLQQFGYDLWASERVIAAVEALPDGDAKADGLRLVSHALRATTRWLERVLDGRSTTTDKVDTPESLRERARANIRAWTAFLEERTAAEFASDVGYVGSDGEEVHAELRVVVAHVLNHATHHRAQAIRHVRLAGVEPPNTDVRTWDIELQAADEEG